MFIQILSIIPHISRKYHSKFILQLRNNFLLIHVTIILYYNNASSGYLIKIKILLKTLQSGQALCFVILNLTLTEYILRGIILL